MNDTIFEHFDYQRRFRGMSNFDLTRSQGLYTFGEGIKKKKGAAFCFNKSILSLPLQGLSPTRFVQNIHSSLYCRTWYTHCGESASHMIWRSLYVWIDDVFLHSKRFQEYLLGINDTFRMGDHSFLNFTAT
jgi:hypothetical protein